VTTYVVDTGISNHIEFMTKNVSRLIGGTSFVYGNTDYHDCHGHGTHVASIIGGNICGVAKDVNIVSVRVFDCDGRGTFSVLFDALNWISKQKKGIVNLSLTGIKFSLLNEVIDSMVKKGFVVVSAAGNNNADACGYSPASVKSAITVGCMEIGNIHCWHSNEGSCVSLFAPGASVLGANILGGYTIKTGTSMASPHVAGIAAQIKERFPRMKPAIIKKVILNNAAKDTLSLQMPNSPNLSARLLRGYVRIVT
jgi:serine protease